jgi:hypothetical protein
MAIRELNTISFPLFMGALASFWFYYIIIRRRRFGI